MNDWLERHRGYLVLVLINFIGMAGIFFTARLPHQGAVEILPPPTVTPAPTSTPVIVTVHVSGAVVNPGVYSLPDPSRVEQALEAAGGFASDAAEAGVNLAQPLMDGQQVYVPREEEFVGAEAVSGLSASAPSAGSSNRSMININTAPVERLTELSGIGPALAGRIVEYRETSGPFRVIEDIKQVKGIGDATFADIQDSITVH